MKSGFIFSARDSVGADVPSTSTARLNRFGRKKMLCVWWDQRSVVFYELLKPEEMVNTKRYQQQLINLNRSLLEKRSEYGKRHHKVIFLLGNVPSRTKNSVRNTSEVLSWEILPRVAFSPDLAPSDHHLFASIRHALAEQCFGSCEDVKKWLDEWFAVKGRCIHKLPKRWENV